MPDGSRLFVDGRIRAEEADRDAGWAGIVSRDGLAGLWPTATATIPPSV